MEAGKKEKGAGDVGGTTKSISLPPYTAPSLPSLEVEMAEAALGEGPSD